MSNQVYINATSAYFPNGPVSNDEMEEYLGYIDGRPSKSKKIVLRNNGITNRYYALDKNGKSTHTNAQMTALAVKELFKNNPDKIKEIELLSAVVFGMFNSVIVSFRHSKTARSIVF